LNSADKPAFELADRNVLDVDPGKIVSIELSKGSGKLEFVKKDAVWASTRAGAKENSTTQIESLLAQMNQAQMVSLEAKGIDISNGSCRDPVLAITTVEESGESQNLLMMAPQAHKYRVCDRSRQILFDISQGAFKSLFDTYRQLQVPPAKETPGN
jgi:hypothetical protein